MAEIFNLLAAGIEGEGFFLFVVCLYIGVIAACAVAIYERRVMGAFVRALLEKEALTPEKARTLSELGYENKSAVKRALRGKGIFAGTVYEASEEVDYDREDHAMPIYRESFDEAKARFYIPEVLKYRAELRFEKKGTHIMALVIGALLFGGLLVLVLIFRARAAEALRQFALSMSA